MEAVMKKHLQMFNFESEMDLEKFRECVQYVKYSYNYRLQTLTNSEIKLLKECVLLPVP